MKKEEKDPKPEAQKEDNFYSLFGKIIKHNPNDKKKPEDKTPKKDK